MSTNMSGRSYNNCVFFNTVPEHMARIFSMQIQFDTM